MQLKNYHKGAGGCPSESVGAKSDQNDAMAKMGANGSANSNRRRSLNSAEDSDEEQAEGGQRSLHGQADGKNDSAKRYGTHAHQGSSNTRHNTLAKDGKRNTAGHPSDMNEEAYAPGNQKTPAVIVQDDVHSSDFLNAKQSNKSIKLINIENNEQKHMRDMEDQFAHQSKSRYQAADSAAKAREREDILSPDTNLEGQILSDMNDINELKMTDYDRLHNRNIPMSAKTGKKNKVQIMYLDDGQEGHASNPGDERDTEYTPDQDEVSDAYIEKIRDINESLKEELAAVVDQMEMQLLRIQEQKRLRAAHEQ